MSVSGIIAQEGLATALQLVSRGRNTGVLVASMSWASATVEFRDGEVLSASSTACSKLGEMLLEKGLVTKEKLEAALWVQKQDKEWRALGRVLVDVRLLPEEVVAAAIEDQIARVLDAMLRWDQGTFRFDAKPLDDKKMVLPVCRDLGQYQVRIALLRADRDAIRDGTVA